MANGSTRWLRGTLANAVSGLRLLAVLHQIDRCLQGDSIMGVVSCSLNVR